MNFWLIRMASYQSDDKLKDDQATGKFNDLIGNALNQFNNGNYTEL